MLPLVPTLVLGFVSFISSAFVVLRIVIPILPPHPLSRRVPPSEFGLPNKTLSPADKSHIWLSACDIVALGLFVWQAIEEHLGRTSGHAIVNDSGSAVRMWMAMTLRQSCLLVIATLTLVHVRMGQPVGFGAKHWMLLSPILILAVTGTGLAGILAGSNVQTFFWGLIVYSASVAVFSSIAFACLISTLLKIRHNLAALSEMRDPWPAATEEKSVRRSFATEDVNALKDGASWITSRASSRCESISAFSFSTHHTHHSRMPSNASSRVNLHPNVASHSSIPAKSSFWFAPASPANHGATARRESPIPPVPPLPAPYRPSSTYNVTEDSDPFGRVDPRIRTGSQSSWLTENPGWQYEPTMSSWSYSPTQDSHELPEIRVPTPFTPEVRTPTLQTGLLHASSLPRSYPSTPDLQADVQTEFLHASLLPTSTAVSRPRTPSMIGMDVLGGYGYAPDASQAESSAANMSALPGNEVDVSVWRIVGWLVTIWVPLALSLPYAITSQLSIGSSVPPLLLVLSVTLSSPLLAANIFFRSPIPIPSGLFDSFSEPPSVVMRAPSPSSSTAEAVVREYKRSGSTTVVEGRRSGDVWLSNGNAAERKTKVARALTLLHPKPKLSVLPPQEEKIDEAVLSPPLPIQLPEDGARSATEQSYSQVDLSMSREMGTRKKDSKASSYYSVGDESIAFASKIMVAQRHYSTLAMTMVFPPSPERRAAPEIAATTAVETPTAAESKRHSHLRARSVTSINASPRSVISAPPSTPLPPTPPIVKNFKAANASKRLMHRKSYSSTAEEFSFGPIDNTREIDALSAGLLPLLVPGLKLGDDIKISESWNTSLSVTPHKGKPRHSRYPSEVGGMSSDFLSPQNHSTSQSRKTSLENKSRKTSAHGRNRFSLPSLSLGKDIFNPLTNWRSSFSHDVEAAAGQNEDSRRNTISGGEISLNVASDEDDASRLPSGYATGRLPSLRLVVPESANPDRSSLSTLISALDEELKMPTSATSETFFSKPPLSAASEVTLFDFDPGMEGLASSTPQDPKAQSRRPSRDSRRSDVAPPAPPKTSSKRSSIVYIKSDENNAPSLPLSDAASSTGRVSPVVLPLAPKPKTPKLRHKKSIENMSLKGLRPLALLQDRDKNRGPVPEVGSTKPLNLSRSGGKKTGKVERENREHRKENVPRDSSLKRALKPLRLGRSETTKQRAVLRENEVLPDVVVRPPSDGQHIGLSYSFQ